MENAIVILIIILLFLILIIGLIVIGSSHQNIDKNNTDCKNKLMDIWFKSDKKTKK
jgi:hypothetical protein